MPMNSITPTVGQEQNYEVTSSELMNMFTMTIDVSTSVIDEIETIIATTKQCIHELKKDDITRGRAVVYLVFFGTRSGNGVASIGPKLCSEFTDEEIDNALKTAGGTTPGEEALKISRSGWKNQLRKWNESGVDWTVPIHLIVSDYYFNNYGEELEHLLRNRDEGKINLIPLALPGFNEKIAARISPDGRHIYGLKEQSEEGFTKLFRWVTAAAKEVSQSVKGDEITLPDPRDFDIIPLTIKL